MGFADPARAERLLLTDLGVRAAELRTDPLVTAIATAADPDLAVVGLARLFGAAAGRDASSRDALRAALRAEEDFRDRDRKSTRLNSSHSSPSRMPSSA